MAVFALGASNVVGFTDLFVAARAGDGDGVGRAVVVWCAGRFLVGVRAVAALGAFTVRRGAGSEVVLTTAWQSLQVTVTVWLPSCLLV